MSQITTSSAIWLAGLLLAATLAGCGDVNERVGFDPALGAHPNGWQPGGGHAQAAAVDTNGCAECHGADFAGGIAGVSCTSCHVESPTSVHPLAWGDYGYARHSAYVAANGTTSCATAACHGPTLAGVAGSGPACATACHLGGHAAKHPAVWTTYSGHADYVQGQGYNSTSCSTAKCHGIAGEGVVLSGPSCFVCHPADPAVAAPVPDKHPHNLVDGTGHFYHRDYLQTAGVAACNTAICHGSGGPGPSCLTSGCHN